MDQGLSSWRRYTLAAGCGQSGSHLALGGLCPLRWVGRHERHTASTQETWALRGTNPESTMRLGTRSFLQGSWGREAGVCQVPATGPGANPG